MALSPNSSTVQFLELFLKYALSVSKTSKTNYWTVENYKILFGIP